MAFSIGGSLEISKGGLVILVGPSGCGASTLSRMNASLEVVTEDEIDRQPVGAMLRDRVLPKLRETARPPRCRARHVHHRVRTGG